ncbi:MAG: hypothetical protein O3A00_00560 [Planctomycetota bacterium]|nr:hypothetical protein [Planctomycetota bacterium]
MQVNDLNQGSGVPQRPVRNVASAKIQESSRLNETEETAPLVAGLESHVQTSPETMELLDKVREIPEIRYELLQEISARLENGEFLTPKAAVETAQAIVEDLDFWEVDPTAAA